LVALVGTVAIVTAAAGLRTVRAAQDVARTAGNDGSRVTAGFTPAAAQATERPVVTDAYTPESSIENPGDAGIRAHTNYVLHSPGGGAPTRMGDPSPSSTFYETPASMGCLYLKSPNAAGCNPNTMGYTVHPKAAGWGAIALVDAYSWPTLAADLKYFDTFFHLPPANFQIVYANGSGACSVPPTNSGWGLEEALDIEWAHVFASKAKIYLVEACSNSYSDLLYAEYIAGGLVSAAGGGDVSNSWGSGEFSSEVSDNPYFYYYYWYRTTYFASAGDSGCGAAYPSSNPWVVSAGGTTVNRDSAGNFSSESCWAGSGGGSSTYQTWAAGYPSIGPWAGYQYELFGQASRQTPDFSFNADPASGVYVRFNGGWYAVGGTSVSSPSLAGIVNAAGNKLGTAPPEGGYYHTGEQNLLYSQLNTAAAYAANFYDVKTGSNGCSVGTKWDYCTGVGSPRGYLGK
jgi:hypothetical protein